MLGAESVILRRSQCGTRGRPEPLMSLSPLSLAREMAPIARPVRIVELLEVPWNGTGDVKKIPLRLSAPTSLIRRSSRNALVPMNCLKKPCSNDSLMMVMPPVAA